MNRSRRIAVTVFALFALMETGDIVRLLLDSFDPAPGAAALGLSQSTHLIRLTVLVLLALGIVLTAAVTVFGVVQRAGWARQGARATAVAFVFYAVFQVWSALALAGEGQAGLIGSGVIYLLAGGLSFWVSRKPAAFAAG